MRKLILLGLLTVSAPVLAQDQIPVPSALQYSLEACRGLRSDITNVYDTAAGNLKMVVDQLQQARTEIARLQAELKKLDPSKE